MTDRPKAKPFIGQKVTYVLPDVIRHDKEHRFEGEIVVIHGEDSLIMMTTGDSIHREPIPFKRGEDRIWRRPYLTRGYLLFHAKEKAT